MRSVSIGTCCLDRGRIVGTLTTAAGLKGLVPEELRADLVEVRLDLIGWAAPGWMEDCLRIEVQGMPVLLTLRMAAEGGRWQSEETARESIYRQALQSVSAIDVELQSALAAHLCELAADCGKTVVLSFHDFEKTPSCDELCGVINTMQGLGDIVAKAACMVRSEADLETLQAVLQMDWDVPICLIGMGPLGTSTRLEFPTRGSCLTYGFIDATSAPGQYSCAELAAALGRD